MRPGLKKRLVSRTWRYTGGEALHRWLLPGGLVVLTFHRVLTAAEAADNPWERNVVEKELFRSLVSVLSRYPLVRLDEGLARLRRPGAEREPTRVAVTFDDGFWDFHEHAWPVLREYNVPVTLFLTAGPVLAGKSPWWDEVSERLYDSPAEVAALPALRRGFPLLCSVIADFDRTRDEGVWERMQRDLRLLPPGPRKTFQYEVMESVPAGKEGRRRGMVTAEQVREMAQAGVAIQSHTMWHPYLDELTPEDLRDDLAASREAIASWTGEPVDLLAYPSGRLPGPAGMAIVRDLFRGAVTTYPGRVLAGTDPHRIGRKDGSYLVVGEGVDPLVASMEIAGALDCLPGRFK